MSVRRSRRILSLCRMSLWLPLGVWMLFVAGCRPSAPHHSTPVADHPTTPSLPQTAPLSASTAMLFKDVTEVSGIHFQHHAHHTPHKYLIETMGSGCAFLDYDGDGYQDILLLNGAPLPGSADRQRSTLQLYHNNHDNTFTDVTHHAGLDTQTMYAMGVAVGDYDNDGREDFYVSCALGGGHLFHNEGNGRFKDVTAQAGVANQGKWATTARGWTTTGMANSIFLCAVM